MENDLVGNNALDIAVGANAIAGALLAAEFHLVKADFTPSRDLLIADLVAIEADYNTYAAEAITFGPATIADTGEIEYIGAAGEFRPTDALAPNEIWGGWVENGAGVLLWIFKFDAALSMGTVLDAILLTLRYRPAINGGKVNLIS